MSDLYIQVYRELPGGRRGRWMYLGRVDLEWEVGRAELMERSADDIEGLIPLEAVRDRWGGGRYQFRFAQSGGKRCLRSRNVWIAGAPRAKWS